MLGNLIHNIPDYLLNIFLFNIIVVNIGMFLVFIYNIPGLFNSKNNLKIKNAFKELLSEILISDIGEKSEKIKIIEILKVQKSRRIRTIFVKVLIEYTIFLKGEDFDKLTGIYKSLGLHQKDIKDLDSIFTKRILNALERLNRFKIVVYRSKIKELQQHKNSSIRELANAYTLNIYDDNIYDFFDYAIEPFTPWQQLAYFQLIINRPTGHKADFSTWINPKYDHSVISLALDLVSYYYQSNAVKPIHEMIRLDDEKIRRKMIKTLGVLNQKDSIDVLKALYDEEKEMSCKMEIIKSLGYMGNNNENVTNFLEELLETEFHTNIRKTILIAMDRAISSQSVLGNRLAVFELEKIVPDEHKIL